MFPVGSESAKHLGERQAPDEEGQSADKEFAEEIDGEREVEGKVEGIIRPPHLLGMHIAGSRATATRKMELVNKYP